MSFATPFSILIADDEAEIREILSEVFRAAFPTCKVVEATNGSEALQKLVRQKFDILVTDLKMPKMDGAQVLTALNKFDPKVQPRQVIIVSAFAQANHFADAVGRIAIFNKPLKMETIDGELKRLLANLPQNPWNAAMTDRGAAAPQASAAPKGPIDLPTIFAGAAIEVISTLSGVTPIKEEVFIRPQDQISLDVSAVVALKSSEYHGSLAISFDHASFRDIVAKMMGSEIDVNNPEIHSAVGEICNQIFNVGRRGLGAAGAPMERAIPAVIPAGERQLILHLVSAPCLAMRFRAGAGRFQLELASVQRTK